MYFFSKETYGKNSILFHCLLLPLLPVPIWNILRNANLFETNK